LEALVNAFCHSRAKRIDFELEYGESDLRLRVRDNYRKPDLALLCDMEKGIHHEMQGFLATAESRPAGYRQLSLARKCAGVPELR
jgi:hypothetical protein